MSAQLYAEIDNLIDKNEIEKIMLTLEEDLLKYDAAAKDLKYYEDQLSFIDKINPFGERDKKGEILKIEYEMADIANIYNADMDVIKSKAAAVIKSIDAFVAKFQVDALMQSIQNIEAHYYGGGRGKFNQSGIQITGKGEALKRVKDLDRTLQQTYGVAYVNCPSYAQFIKGYMLHLTEPYHLPLKLKVP